MLMENAGKVLQSVAANIDSDIFSPLLQRLYDTVLLTDESNRLQGDEQIRVRGVVFANQKETERARILEFLQLAANPIDTEIIGVEGRAELLREVADRIGLDHLAIVPDADTLAARQQEQQMAMMQQGGMPIPGQMPAPGQPSEAGRPEEGMRGGQYGPGGSTT
jgi:hypothetical protein